MFAFARKKREDVDHPTKNTIAEHIRSSASAGLRTLRVAGLRVGGVSVHELDVTAEEEQDLFSLARFVLDLMTDQLDGFEGLMAEGDGMLQFDGPPNLVEKLNDVPDDIYRFEKELEEDSVVRRIGLTNERRAKVELYTERLDKACLELGCPAVTEYKAIKHEVTGEARGRGTKNRS